MDYEKVKTLALSVEHKRQRYSQGKLGIALLREQASSGILRPSITAARSCALLVAIEKHIIREAAT